MALLVELQLLAWEEQRVYAFEEGFVIQSTKGRDPFSEWGLGVSNLPATKNREELARE